METVYIVLIEVALGILCGFIGSYVFWRVKKYDMTYWEVLGKYGYIVGATLAILVSILLVVSLP